MAPFASLRGSVNLLRRRMSNDDADKFRKQADECRQQAEKAISPLDKEAWLRVAGEWIKLAMSVEERRRE
jgi:hypothetical protein